MKKVLIALSALALLTACSTDNTAKVSDGETVYINSENEFQETIFKKHIYNSKTLL